MLFIGRMNFGGEVKLRLELAWEVAEPTISLISAGSACIDG